MHCCHFALLGVCVLLDLAATAQAAEKTAPDAARARELTAMLPAVPRGSGPAITDREAWGRVAKSPQFRSVVPEAEILLKRPVPELTDDLYLDFSRTGNRRRCEAVMRERHGRLWAMVLAECIEDRGRFLPAIEQSIRDMSREKTWVMPAHDHGLANFQGKTAEIDLQAAAIGWGLATTRWWLGERLSPATRKLIHDELERRIFTPFTSMVTAGEPRLWWLTGTNNWNAVCLAGVTGAALAQIESPERRAFFVAAAEGNIRHFLSGITADGYCSEGMGYWNYGFSHYVLLAEAIHQATGGKVDLMEDAKVRQLALYGLRMQIVPGICPAFADCAPNAQPDTRLMAFLSRRYELGLGEVESHGLLLDAGPNYFLPEFGLWGFANSASRRAAAKAPPPYQLRDWFSDAGILICRPRADQKGGLAVALKGGHNAEHHNHNDVGSFVVVVGNQTPLVDPGSEIYTARTFSGKRYDSNVLNSFGHPVPRVAGKLQRAGRQSEAKVLKTQFTPEADTLVLDISSAYPVKGLKKLTRTFIFTRKQLGSLQVIDEVEFGTPQEFETALVTFSKWEQVNHDSLVVGDQAGKVVVTIAVAGDSQEFRVEATEIKEDLPGRRLPTRLGIGLVKPVRRARIELEISGPPSGKITPLP